MNVEQQQKLKSGDDIDQETIVTGSFPKKFVDAPGISGILASVVVLRSEFVLKTTGCGLPAGPFGIVGAIEGISYLGVVAILASSIVSATSGDEGKTDSMTYQLAVVFSQLAAVFGLAVLAFQLTDYGYIPNAVPMEGGMCE